MMADSGTWRHTCHGHHVAHGVDWVASLRGWNEIVVLGARAGEVRRTHVVTRPAQGIAALTALQTSVPGVFSLGALTFCDVGHAEDTRSIRTEIVDCTTGSSEVVDMDRFLSAREASVEAARKTAADNDLQLLKETCEWMLGDRAVVVHGHRNTRGDVGFVTADHAAYVQAAGKPLVRLGDAVTALALHPNRAEVAIAMAGSVELVRW